MERMAVDRAPGSEKALGVPLKPEALELLQSDRFFITIDPENFHRQMSPRKIHRRQTPP